jgi:putative transposase
VHKAFKYRLYPTDEQDRALAEMLETHRRLYNRALAERKTAWEERQESVSYGQQAAHLKDKRTTNAYLARTNFSSCQATMRRLDRAFQAFFRRVKAGETPGYPRFKGRNPFDTVEFPPFGDGCKLDGRLVYFPPFGDGCKLDGRLVYFQHVGRVKIKLHRPVESTIKTISFKREADGWHVIFSCELPTAEVAHSLLQATSIDLGLKAFLVTADGVRLPRRATTARRRQRSNVRSVRSPASRRGATAARRRCSG